MNSSSLFAFLFTFIFMGITMPESQAQLKYSDADTTFENSENIISEEMLSNTFLCKVQFNTTQTIFDKPVTKAFLVFGKTISNTIISNNFDVPTSYSGFSPKNTAEFYNGYRSYERTNQFPISKRSYGFIRTDF